MPFFESKWRKDKNSALILAWKCSRHLITMPKFATGMEDFPILINLVLNFDIENTYLEVLGFE